MPDINNINEQIKTFQSTTNEKLAGHQSNNPNQGQNSTPKENNFRRGDKRGPRKDRDNRNRRGDRDQRRASARFKKDRRGFKNKKKEDELELESKVILVRRVTRVVKGGKRMRFSALVAVGDKNGKVGIGLRKGADYQDSVNKATRKAKSNLLEISLNQDGSLTYPSKTKHKACVVYLKPAKTGTGLIAGGYVRPVLELAGVKNVYSKIVASRNKVAGTQATFEALTKYKK